MTALMHELADDQHSHELPGLSIAQLEQTLVAANLLLRIWRTNIPYGFGPASQAASRAERSLVCPQR